MMPGVVLTSAAVCDRLDAAGLLRDDAGVVRVPVLVRGRLVVPEAGGVLEIREPTLDRATMRADGGARRLVLPHPSRGTLLLEAPISPELKAGFERFGFDEHEADPEPFKGNRRR